MGYDVPIRLMELVLNGFWRLETLLVTDTLQFDDYANMSSAVDPAEKAKRHREVFPGTAEGLRPWHEDRTGREIAAYDQENESH